jgi:hypothetical protein
MLCFTAFERELNFPAPFIPALFVPALIPALFVPALIIPALLAGIIPALCSGLYWSVIAALLAGITCPVVPAPCDIVTGTRAVLAGVDPSFVPALFVTGT